MAEVLGSFTGCDGSVVSLFARITAALKPSRGTAVPSAGMTISSHGQGLAAGSLASACFQALWRTSGVTLDFARLKALSPAGNVPSKTARVTRPAALQPRMARELKRRGNGACASGFSFSLIRRSRHQRRSLSLADSGCGASLAGTLVPVTATLPAET